ncbi:hypothetical protein AB3S75_000983 [Citrus x aurantiifolia]
MASSSNNSSAATTMAPAAAYGSDSATTFVQADPSTFRQIVQKLTGAPDDPSSPKLPVTHPARAVTSAAAAITPAAVAGANMGPKRPAFKLHERRQTAKKLEIKLNNNNNNNTNINNSSSSSSSNVYSNGYELCSFYKQRGGGTGAFLVSPVSTLEFLAPRVSPRSPREELLCARGGGGGEEERAVIAEKGFYLHPSPLSTPRGGAEPGLLPLFPLTSPRNNDPHNSSN